MLLLRNLTSRTHQPVKQFKKYCQMSQNFTPSELTKYNAPPKIYIAVKGVVFDVSKSESFYGPQGPYKLYAGKDASLGLARTSLDENDLKGTIDDLEPEEIRTLDEWFTKFSSKYPKVGNLIPEPKL
eukprot:TRINITY_DN11762_c0_g1_i1.p1 TRINITY_DN11762_c0_g1~~TRINITY_DN11762_c0_g1_i1.p1  ORF type:complete len:127 (+),score=20.09 TRINITY_DN11762_c0_g1_i1:147-527(+)